MRHSAVMDVHQTAMRIVFTQDAKVDVTHRHFGLLSRQRYFVRRGRIYSSGFPPIRVKSLAARARLKHGYRRTE